VSYRRPIAAWCTLAAALSFVPPAPAQQGPSGPPPDLDAYIARVLSTFQVPGLSVAIVKDGRVVVAKGYGVKKLGEPGRVDARTRFGIASNTKAFSATAIGMLVEEGKLAWDAPVINYLPWFAMSDPFVTRELTVRDLLVHRSGLGLGAGDLLWWPQSDYDRKEIVRRLRYLPLATSFRSTYAYDNVLYSVAGEVIEAVSGQPWEDFVGTRILAKVGMSGSNVRHSEGGRGDNTATPHAPVDGVVRPVAASTSDNVNPAGGINSSAEDMAKWVLVQLDSGRTADGSRLFSTKVTRQLWTPVTPMPIGDPPPELAALRPNFRFYGLGFDLQDYRGTKMAWHTGGLPGYVSRVSLIPELRLGVVVLTNQESGAAFTALSQHIIDWYLGAPSPDYIGIYRKLESAGSSDADAGERAALAHRDSTSGPSLPLAKYAGTYTDRWYGDIRITLEQGKLVMRFAHTPGLSGELQHFQHDTFIARWADRELRADAYVTFSLNADGTIAQATMAAVSAATDFSFDFQDLLLRPTKVAAAMIP
jgi:CubicO group peptidase (beta-lactamase class C family)